MCEQLNDFSSTKVSTLNMITRNDDRRKIFPLYLIITHQAQWRTSSNPPYRSNISPECLIVSRWEHLRPKQQQQQQESSNKLLLPGFTVASYPTDCVCTNRLLALFIARSFCEVKADHPVSIPRAAAKVPKASCLLKGAVPAGGRHPLLCPWPSHQLREVMPPVPAPPMLFS